MSFKVLEDHSRGMRNTVERDECQGSRATESEEHALVSRGVKLVENPFRNIAVIPTGPCRSKQTPCSVSVAMVTQLAVLLLESMSSLRCRF